MATHFLSAKAVNLGVTEKSSTLPDGVFLGQQEEASDGALYELVRADGAVDQYAAVIIDEAGDAAMATTTNCTNVPGKIGVAQIAAADNDYLWVIRKGPLTVKGAASCVKDVKLYTTATAGVVDDTATVLIQGLRIDTTLTGAASVGGTAVDLLVVNS